jgi:hypothetical protein
MSYAWTVNTVWVVLFPQIRHLDVLVGVRMLKTSEFASISRGVKMEIQKIDAEVVKKIITCKEGEFIFVTYDSSKDPEIASDEIKEIMSYCQDNGCQCLFLPEKDEQVSVALQDFDADALRRLEKKVHEALQKKSKLILPG